MTNAREVQQLIEQLVERWKGYAETNTHLMRKAPSEAWKMVYADRRDIYRVCAQDLSALLTAAGQAPKGQPAICLECGCDIDTGYCFSCSVPLTAAGRDQKVKDQKVKELNTRVDDGQPQASEPTGSTASSNEELNAESALRHRASCALCGAFIRRLRDRERSVVCGKCGVEWQP
jgi:ribosomal protein S27AE